MPTSTQPAAGPPIPSTFTVAIDTREQLPYEFWGLRANANQGRRPIVLRTQRTTLAQGDYAILGQESLAAIERKSLADLYGTVGRGRERFARELERLDTLRVAFVVVESSWEMAMAAPPARCELHPRALNRSVLTWQVRYPRVHWCWFPGRYVAEKMTYRILEKVWLECVRSPQK